MFATDAYRRLSLREVVAIYLALLPHPEALAGLQDLIFDRLAHIEGEIDTKIDALIIEFYKRELATLYLKGIVRRDFADKRLRTGNRGFRALGNEIKLILDAGLYSPAELLADAALNSNEKRRVIERGCVPEAAVREHLARADVPEAEREILAALVD